MYKIKETLERLYKQEKTIQKETPKQEETLQETKEVHEPSYKFITVLY